MKIYSTNRINALGLKGPEETPKEITKFIKYPIENIEVDNDNIQESEKILFEKAKEIFNKNEKQIFIGGDHSITYPILKAFQEKNRNPFLIIFDAHVDCDYCAKEPTHEEWLRGIIEAGFNPRNIILIGARKIWDIERKFLIENKIKVFNGIFDIEAATDYITERANGQDLYISIDIDALDPAFAPAVSYPEPAGLSSKEFFYIFKRLLRIKSLKTIDVVEAIPQKDKNYNSLTLRTIAKIVEEAKSSTSNYR
jgi:arginase family enzyme